VSTRRILEAYHRWSAAGEPLVLVTVVETEGSTYTKAGHRILVAASGEFRGLVSGGCLEGDLAEHARAVLASGRAQRLTYDLRDENDDLWGLGIGCNGLFRVLLQPLSPANDYAPFGAIAACLQGDTPGVTATVTESEDEGLPAGATALGAGEAARFWQVPPAWQPPLAAACRQTARAVIETLALDGRRACVLVAPLVPLPRLLVLGAGLDAVPLVAMARELGWRVTVADHRPAYLARGDLGAADEVLRVEPERLEATLAPGRFAASVVMSHHLATDRAYLRSLAAHALPYVGLLGPAARGARLLGEIGTAAESLRGRLHSPVGLRIGADSPESIALAILGQVHAALHGRTGAQGITDD
jgi:xanthine/CO dehydrogenase XdhC/CoxF family maturation factor